MIFTAGADRSSSDFIRFTDFGAVAGAGCLRLVVLAEGSDVISVVGEVGGLTFDRRSCW